jgi:hypothetical protein
MKTLWPTNQLLATKVVVRTKGTAWRSSIGFCRFGERMSGQPRRVVLEIRFFAQNLPLTASYERRMVRIILWIPILT